MASSSSEQKPSAARRRPPPLTLPLAPVANEAPIVVGVLSKYDFGKAWRPRLFVLHPGVGVLAYYKLRAGVGGGIASAAAGGGGSVGAASERASSSGDAPPPPPPSPSDPDVAALLDGLRLEGEVSLVGAQVSVLEAQWRRRRQRQQAAGVGPAPPRPSASSASLRLEPAGEVALQVASFSASATDRRKLYVHAGTRRIAVRAETSDDRWAWLDALASAKGSLPPLTLASPGLRPAISGLGLTGTAAAGCPPDDGGGDAGAATAAPSVPTARSLRARLRELGASSAAADEAAKALDDARRAASAAAHAAAAAERRELLSRIARLENDRRQLETALVVERELANSGGSGSAGAPSPLSLSRSFATSPLSPGGRLLGWARSGAAALLGRTAAAAAASPPSSSASPSPQQQEADEQAGQKSGSNILARRRQRRRLKQQLKQQRKALASTTTGAAAFANDSAAASVGAASSVADSTDDGFDEDESTDDGDEGESDGGCSTEEERGGGGKDDAFFDASDGDAEPVRRPATPTWLARLREDPSSGAAKHRSALPEPQQREASVSLWSIIRECVGRDLTRVCLPVYFNEPLSALQKVAEEMEYSELLDEAAALPANSVERLLKVAAFAVSAYSSSVPLRTRKPFNPLLSETFELVRPDKGFRFLAEKVVHHPTVVAAAAEGRGWTFSGDADVRSKFWGRSIELTPVGLLTLRFDDGEEFRWKKVVTSISGLILGRLHVEHGGVMRVSSGTSGLTAVLKFKEPGLFSSSSAAPSASARSKDGGISNHAHEVKGHVEQTTDGSTRKLASPLISGSWSESLTAVYLPDAASDGGDGTTPTATQPKRHHVSLWRCSPPPPDPTRYCLTSFAISLNEITDTERNKMAPTDSRLRPDQRYLELGIHDRANAEKQRLERKQRAARAAADRGEKIVPRWFERVNEGDASPGEAPMYRFTGEYWQCRERGVYPRCRDIFGEDGGSGSSSPSPSGSPAGAGAPGKTADGAATAGAAAGSR